MSNLAIIVTALASATNAFHLPPGLLSAVCWVESRHTATAVHNDDGGGNSLGLCQIKLSTAKTLGFKGTTKQLMRPKTNAYYAAAYLKQQMTRYDLNVPKALAAYNAGSCRYNDRGLIKNRKYVYKTLNAWMENK